MSVYAVTAGAEVIGFNTVSPKRENSIHVLHVIPTLMPGGMELAMVRIINSLNKGDMRHSVVGLKGDALIRDYLDPSVPVHCLMATPNEALLPLRLVTLIRQVRPTVIHARNWGAWPDIAVARLLARTRVPLIFSFHGFDFAGRIPYRRRVACRLLEPLTSHIFTVSEASKKFLSRKVGLPPGRIQVIPNGVDLSRFQRSERSVPQATLVVGTVGSLTKVKNQSLLLRACARLIKHGVDAEVRIAGEGPERATLMDVASFLGISRQVRLLGHVADVAEFLNQLDIFVLPSDSEQHPNALLEAMACGLPCIGTRVGGVPEILGDGRYGYVVNPGDENALTNALQALSREPPMRVSWGEKARERVARRYNMDIMLRAYADLYRKFSRGGFGVTGERRSILCPESEPRPSGAVCAAPRSRGALPRVLMVGPTPPLTGGMAAVIGNLCNSDLVRRCRVTVLNNGKTTEQGRPLFAGIASQVALLFRLIGSTVGGRAQIVHIHTCSGFTFWRDCFHGAVAGLLGSHVIWHVHGAKFDDFLAQRNRIGRRLVRLAFERASAVIVLSGDWVCRLCRFVPRAKWRVVENGVSVPGQAPFRKSRQPVFLFLGDLGERKGVRDLVRAVSVASYGGFDCRIDVAGNETEPGERAAIEKLIAELGCESRVRLVGVLSGEAKEQALSSAACLVLPSYAEGLPMAVLEAMAYGMPVIATRVGAIPEVVTDGHEGFLIEPGDVEALADRMLKLSNDPELRKRMGQAARRRVEAKYSLDVMVERIMDVYREVLARKPVTQ